ncbi:MAG: SdrD B-like domain-containing protein [Bifidobacteriaceae bacterium]|nr:SdrD B-like domain-containing protein [Bifidobacteriaceae bacterium]
MSVTSRIANNSDGSQYVPASFDNNHEVKIIYDKALPLDTTLYKVEWKIGNRWIESDAPAQNSVDMRISFNDGLFTDNYAKYKNMQIFIPIKAKSSYESDQAGKQIGAVNNVSFGSAISENIISASVLRQISPIVTDISGVVNKGIEASQGRLKTSWDIYSTLTSDVLKNGFNVEFTLDIPNQFDVSTLQFDDKAWTINWDKSSDIFKDGVLIVEDPKNPGHDIYNREIKVQKIVVENKNINLTDTTDGRWQKNLNTGFTISTRAYYVTPSGMQKSFSIKASSTVTWPGIKGYRGLIAPTKELSDTQAQSNETSGSVVLSAAYGFSGRLSAEESTVEAGRPLRWNLEFSTDGSTPAQATVGMFPPYSLQIAPRKMSKALAYLPYFKDNAYKNLRFDPADIKDVNNTREVTFCRIRGQECNPVLDNDGNPMQANVSTYAIPTLSKIIINSADLLAAYSSSHNNDASAKYGFVRLFRGSSPDLMNAAYANYMNEDDGEFKDYQTKVGRKFKRFEKDDNNIDIPLMSSNNNGFLTELDLINGNATYTWDHRVFKTESFRSLNQYSPTAMTVVLPPFNNNDNELWWKASNYTQTMGFSCTLEFSPYYDNRNPSKKLENPLVGVWPLNAVFERRVEDITKPVTKRVIETLESNPESIRTIPGSTLSGYVFNDADLSHTFTKGEDGEAGYEGIPVKLTKDDGSYTRTVQTDSSGKYIFENLERGKYTLSLDSVDVEAGDNKIVRVKDYSGNWFTDDCTKYANAVSSSPKNPLRICTTNRYNEKKRTLLTVANDRFENSASSTIPITVQTGKNLENVNFGFITPNPDLKVDQTPASVNTIDNSSNQRVNKVSWGISVKNTGNVPLSNLKLNTVTSNDLAGVDATAVGGEPEKITMMDGTFYSSSSDSTIVGTDKDHVFYVQYDKSSGKTEIRRFKNITGKPVGMLAKNYYNPFVIATSDGIWVNKDGKGVNSILTNDDGYQKINIPGLNNNNQVTQLFGLQGDIHYRVPNRAAWSFTTSNGSYYVRRTDTSGCEINSKYANADCIQRISLPGKVVKVLASNTTDYNYAPGSTLSDNTNISGSFVVVNDNGRYRYYLVDYKASYVEVTGITGEFVKADGLRPFDTGVAVATKSGLWVLKGNSPALNSTASPTYNIVNLTNGYTRPFKINLKNYIKIPAYKGVPTDLVASDPIWSVTLQTTEEIRSYHLVKAIFDDGKDAAWSHKQLVNNYGTLFRVNPGWTIGYTIYQNPNSGVSLLGTDRTNQQWEDLKYEDKDYNGIVRIFKDDIQPLANYSNSELPRIRKIWSAYDSNSVSGRTGTITLLDTVDGIYVLYYNGTDGKPLSKDSIVLKKLPDIVGDNVVFKTQESVQNYKSNVTQVATDTGLWYVYYNDDISDIEVRKVDTSKLIGSDSASSLFTIDTVRGDKTTNRAFKLPTIKPGDTFNITLSGNIQSTKSVQYLVNQTYITDEQTPRGKLSYTTTGAGMPSGVPTPPDASKLNASNYSRNVTGLIDGNDGTVQINTTLDEDYDLADVTPARVDALPSVAPADTYLNGYAWFDSNRNSKKDSGEPGISGVTVTILKNINNTNTPIVDTVTNSSGRWSVKVPSGSYYVRYNISSVKYQDKKIAPISLLSNNSGSKIRADGSIRNTVSSRISDSDMNSLDAGFSEIISSLKVVKGAKDDSVQGEETVTIKTQDELPVNPASILDPIPTPTSVNASMGNSFDDGDGNSSTFAHTFTITNTGKETLTDIRIFDEKLSGNDAVLFIDGKQYISGDTLMSSGNPSEKRKLEPGQSITGVVRVAFSMDVTEHHDEMKVIANAVRQFIDDSSVTRDVQFEEGVTDKDQMKIVYNNYGLAELRINVQDSEQKADAGLPYAAFKVYQVNSETDAGGKEYASIVSDESGLAKVRLKDGIFRIEEISAPDGYLKPTNNWYLTVSRNSDGETLKEPKISTSASGIYFGKDPSLSSTAWYSNNTIRTVLYNVKIQNLPSTGGVFYIFIIAFILFAIGLGLSYYEKPKEKDEELISM